MDNERLLWVIGANDYNLGTTLIKQADLQGQYTADRIFASNEQTADVGSTVHLNAFVKRMAVESAGEPLDVVYCAGVNYLDRIEHVDELDLWNTFNVNVLGFIRMLRVVLKHWDSGQLNVVAVASDAARTPMRNSIAYCSSKAALVQAVRVAARELAPRVRVNAVSPAIIDGTPMTTAIDAAVRLQRGWTEEEALAYERSLIPMGRRATKEEVCEVILQTLAGPEFLTGANIEITGGK